MASSGRCVPPVFAVKGEQAIALTAVFTYWETTEQYAASAERKTYSGPCIERFGLDLATKAPWYDEKLVQPALNELPDLND